MAETIRVKTTLGLDLVTGDPLGEVQLVTQLVNDLDGNVLVVDGASYLITVEEVEKV